MAGTVSLNPEMLIISVFIILAWKTAGWWGLDRWLLPSLGTPWSTKRTHQDQSKETYEQKYRTAKSIRCEHMD